MALRRLLHLTSMSLLTATNYLLFIIMKKSFFLIVMSLVAMITIGQTKGLAQDTKTPAKSEILQVVEVPSGITIHEGVTKNGNPKYWVTIGDGSNSVDVAISATNAEKFKKGQIRLEIVKRRNLETGRISYSTRQLGGGRGKKSTTPDIDLTTLSKK